MKFLYKARTKEGKVQDGAIEASSRKIALATLEKYGLYVTSLNQSGRGGFLAKNITFRKISSKDIVFFTRQFSVMLKSAIPPIEALKSQVAQTENTDFRERILKIAETIEKGGTLSQAFSLFPKIFNPFYVSVIKSGEATGKVADSLNYLADHLEKEYNLHQKIRGAMIYPAFVIVVFVAAFFLVTFFIVPKISEILISFGGDLPFATKAIIFISNFTRAGGWIIILGLMVVLFFLPQILKRTKFSKDFYDRFSLKIPILGDFLKKVNVVSFCQNLSVLISSGLPITQALKITEDILENSVYKKIVAKAEERVIRGEKLSTVLAENSDFVPAFVQQMVSTGERTGNMEKNLMDVVDFYGAEIERTTDNLTTILEPVLLLFLGVGIAILAISIFVPLFKMGLGGM